MENKKNIFLIPLLSGAMNHPLQLPYQKHWKTKTNNNFTLIKSNTVAQLKHISLLPFYTILSIYHYTQVHWKRYSLTLMAQTITKTHLYNFDPLKPHFYIGKLGFTGVYIIFLISAQKHRLWYSLEPPWRGGSNKYPQSMFWAEMWKKNPNFYLKIFIFWWQNFQYIFE